MSKHPQYGMKGSKPRAESSPEPPADSPDLSRAEAARKRFEINSKLDQEYKEKRNRKLSVELHHKEILLALFRDQLIEKDLATKQAAYLLIGLRQTILSIPSKVGQRFRSNPQAREIVQEVKQICHEALRKCANLPNCVEKDWMKRVEEEEEE